MSAFDDDRDDMTSPSAADSLDDTVVEALLRGTAVSDAPRLAELLLVARAVGRAPAPEPSAALAALLAGGTAAEPTLLHPRWRRRLATVAVLSVGTSAGLVGAAAANVLPQRAQQVVARVVNDVSPLTLPGVHPGRHRGLVHRPATSPAGHRPGDVTPPPGLAPTTAATATPTPGVSAPVVSPTPTPGHSADGSGRPTALPSQANGRGDDHGRATHSPSAGEGQGHGKPGSTGPAKGAATKTPKAKTSHGSSGGNRSSGKAKHLGTTG